MGPRVFLFVLCLPSDGEPEGRFIARVMEARVHLSVVAHVLHGLSLRRPVRGAGPTSLVCQLSGERDLRDLLRHGARGGTCVCRAPWLYQPLAGGLAAFKVFPLPVRRGGRLYWSAFP